MGEKRSAQRLLADAADIYDADARLRDAAAQAWRKGFLSGAQWMAMALKSCREGRGGRTGSVAALDAHRLQILGIVKYATAGSAAAVCIVAARLLHSPLPLVLAPIAFYLVEVQMLFLFPLALDGSATPFRDAARLTHRAGGTLRAVGTVMVLALVMLLGGFAGRGVRALLVPGLPVGMHLVRRGFAPAARGRGEMRLLARGLHVRQEVVEGGIPRSMRLLYASDLHLGLSWTRSIIDDLVDIARDQAPDLVLLGGDLVENRGGLDRLLSLVRDLRETCPHVYAVEGNHDRRVGLSSVRNTIQNAGAQWLDSAMHGSIQLESRPDSISAASDYRVLVAHDPAVFAQAADAGFDLVLAGHLHGGQCVLFSRGGRMYPGALFARYTGLRFARGRTTMLVSRGAGDTLPLRWNCPREVILCTIQ